MPNDDNIHAVNFENDWNAFSIAKFEPAIGGTMIQADAVSQVKINLGLVSYTILKRFFEA